MNLPRDSSRVLSYKPAVTIGATGDDVLQLNERERGWVDYIDANVVDRLKGTSNEKARTAAVVTWWALKEGVLDLANPWRQNLCGTRRLGDLETCGGGAWQLGMAGIQGNAASDAEVERVAGVIYPGRSLANVLDKTASDAEVDASTRREIASSTGTLRRAWLLRDPAIAFTIQEPFVERQCLRAGAAGWCYGAWETARKFASSASRVQEVIDALETRFRTGIDRRWRRTLATWTLLLGGGVVLAWWLHSERGSQRGEDAEEKSYE